jgi:hypothetical protein
MGINMVPENFVVFKNAEHNTRVICPVDRPPTDRVRPRLRIISARPPAALNSSSAALPLHQIIHFRSLLAFSVWRSSSKNPAFGYTLVKNTRKNRYSSNLIVLCH